MRQSQPHLTCSTVYTERMPTETVLPSDQSLSCPPSIPFRYWQLADEITNATTSSHGSLIIRLCTGNVFKNVLPSEVLLPSKITNTRHISPTIQVCQRLAHSEKGLLPGTTGHCHVSPAVVYTWWISTQMALQSDMLLLVLCTQVNIHWDGIAIRNYLLLSHQFYAHNWMSTEMAFESEIVCCSLISFMDTSECPPRWHCNQKSSVVVWSVLCTQASLHRDGVAITNYPLLPDQFYAILSVSHHLYAHK